MTGSMDSGDWESVLRRASMWRRGYEGDDERKPDWIMGCL